MRELIGKVFSWLSKAPRGISLSHTFNDGDPKKQTIRWIWQDAFKDKEDKDHDGYDPNA